MFGLPLEFCPFIRSYNLKENWPSISQMTTGNSSWASSHLHVVILSGLGLHRSWACCYRSCCFICTAPLLCSEDKGSSQLSISSTSFTLLPPFPWGFGSVDVVYIFHSGLSIFYVLLSVHWSVAHLYLSPSTENRSLPDGGWEIQPFMGIKINHYKLN